MIALSGLLLFASCRMSFAAKTLPATGAAGASVGNPSGTVIRSDAMEMRSPEGGDTVFRFTGDVQVESENFQASAQALTAHLSGNPIEENSREREGAASPHLTQLLAEGEVRIQVHQEEGERLGSADRVEIDPPNDLFVLSGHAQIQQEGKGTVAGGRIVLDRGHNSLSIEGDLPEGEGSPASRPRLRLEPSAIPEAVRVGAEAEIPAVVTGGEASGSASPPGREESIGPVAALPKENCPEEERDGERASSSRGTSLGSRPSASEGPSAPSAANVP
ncbi:MAG: hypothetical protein LBT57_02905 [Puniceicoccales bacterium]|jgi:lipopolysaccharide export system protein LptA|nr:hypothetical protein [Puniceicoccales bacterium]